MFSLDDGDVVFVDNENSTASKSVETEMVPWLKNQPTHQPTNQQTNKRSNEEKETARVVFRQRKVHDPFGFDWTISRFLADQTRLRNGGTPFPPPRGHGQQGERERVRVGP